MKMEEENREPGQGKDFMEPEADDHSMRNRFRKVAVDLAGQFTTLKTAHRELWVVYGLKFLESYSYFSMAVVFTIFLSDEFQMSDTQAGISYGIMGTCTSLYGFAVGFLIDRLGVRTSLLIGCCMSFTGRLALTFTSSPILLAIIIYFVLPVGSCLAIPVLTLAIKGYTTEKNRGYAFGLFYSIMNLGVLLSGVIVDTATITLPRNGFLGLTPNRMIFLSGACSSGISLLCTLLFLKGNKLPSETEDALEGGGAAGAGSGKESKPSQSFVAAVREIAAHRTFWRFFFLTLIMVNLRSIFRHLDATLPKYMTREFGDKVPKGTIYSINPFMIILLVPVIAALSQKWEHFDVIHVGSYVSAASVWTLAVDTSIPSAVVFVVILSLGEAVWSPRLYDYTVSVAPEGKEGAFMALSSAPLFFSTMPVGALSGYLLQTYCPETGPRDSRMMWFVIALLTSSSPLLLTLTQRWVREPKAKRKSDATDEMHALMHLPPSDEELYEGHSK